MLFTAYPWFFRTGSFDLIGGVTLSFGSLFIFKPVRGLYLHNSKIVLLVSIFQIIASASFYFSYSNYGNKFTLSTLSEFHATDIIGLISTVIIFSLFCISVYNSEYTIKDEA